MCDGAGEVHDIPISVIQRPLVPIVDEGKVTSLCSALREDGGGTEKDIPPVTVLWVEGTEGGNYYYAFGGCHRYEAYKRSGRDTIPAIIQKVPIESLKTILGASAPTSLR
jgi:sulfiredoxin